MTYASEVLGLAQRVAESQSEPVRRAAALFVTSIMAAWCGQRLRLGTFRGHRHGDRRAGLRPGAEQPPHPARPGALRRGAAQRAHPELERDPAVAQRIYDLAPVEPADVFVLVSSSGVNGTVVELATIVKDRGHPLIAITSVQHSTRMTSRHPSGRKLLDLADVVLDNGAPYGDAVLDLPGGGSYGAVSTITSALLAQMVVTEAVDKLVALGETPPIYLSANVTGGDEHNLALESRYAGRIRRGS